MHNIYANEITLPLDDAIVMVDVTLLLCTDALAVEARHCVLDV